ncbi:phage major tail protein, TP901-1 family [Halalkalibacterium halodurans]|uniref:Phage tail protein n=1 Tax=Halalkalibacterium halodurans TaxID=86665 RepID=A0A0M0KMN1_ALKHA|nr:phage major tail protein, TP901-1 family [Halalkalibacterium halodurans]TPE67977.1 phage major tail protein, TP901-1 family [Halalkalibacterium halodurans]
MAMEYKGDEVLFAVAISDENGETLVRPFNQTGGSTNISAESIDLTTKDKTGSDYGSVSQEVSLEGIVTEGDPFVNHIKKAIRNKEFVKIYEIDTRTKEAEHGMYMVSSFERTYSNGEFATYSLSGTLNGEVSEETLVEIPEGAPATEETP